MLDPAVHIERSVQQLEKAKNQNGTPEAAKVLLLKHIRELNRLARTLRDGDPIETEAGGP